ncbi:hypothetical protein LCGC14_0588980 [marine sediment metagenome]|uniref:Uncharacterized protein n=1 Tax=marine sediment metagenome TaxID=412755 RepID=A0A0F9U062_9ZZZZ
MKSKVMLIWAILTILLGVTVHSQLPLCNVDSKISIGENCTFLTPVINCSGANFYDIINLSGIEVVNDAPLTELNESIFFFNFTLTQEPNDFIVRLCEGSTKEIQVISGGEGEVTQADMAFIAIAILIIGIIFIIFKASFSLDDERHWQLKMGLFYGGIALGWAALNLTLRIAEDVGLTDNFQRSLEIIYGAYTIIGLLVVIYLAIIFFRFTFLKFLAIAKALTKQKDKDEGEDQAW